MFLIHCTYVDDDGTNVVADRLLNVTTFGKAFVPGVPDEDAAAAARRAPLPLPLGFDGDEEAEQTVTAIPTRRSSNKVAAEATAVLALAVFT